MEKKDILANFAARREPVTITPDGAEPVTLYLRPAGFLEMQAFFTEVPETQNRVVAAVANLVETEAGEKFTYDEVLTLDHRISKPLLSHVRARLNLEDEGAEKN